jgi:hypothetical protein
VIPFLQEHLDVDHVNLVAATGPVAILCHRESDNRPLPQRRQVADVVLILATQYPNHRVLGLRVDTAGGVETVRLLAGQRHRMRARAQKWYTPDTTAELNQAKS